MNDLRTEAQKLLDIYARRVWPWDIERELMPSMAALSAALAQPQAEPDDLYWRLHSLSKSLESSGRIDEHDNPDAYATVLDAMNAVREQPQAEPVIDCRTCRHYTTASGGCLSVIRCVDGVAYQRAGIRQYWRDGNLTG